MGGRDSTLWASVGIYGGDANLWFSGDTAGGEVFEEIGERAGPFDYAFVGIGAHEPRVIVQNVHTTPEEAVAIATFDGSGTAGTAAGMLPPPGESRTAYG